MRITLPSGTPAEICLHPNPRMGLVVSPDIFGLRPLYEEMVERMSREWEMSVIAVDQFPGLGLGPDIEPRVAAIPSVDDADHLRDLLEGADALGDVAHVGLLGYCMGGMYCFKSAVSARFERIVSFYGMIVEPEAWRGPGHAEPLACLIKGYSDNVLAVLGGRDPYTPEADIAQLRALGVQIAYYPEAEHAFAHDPSRPVHRADDAADAFARAKTWLLSALS